MIHAYEETYLSDAMHNLGDMFDYALCDLGYDPEVFYMQFLFSGVADHIGRGNPKYVAGLSGPELAVAVIYKTEGTRPTVIPSESMDRSPAYWAGWTLAYYQWISAHSFAYLKKRGVTITRVLAMYPTLHEADLSKFVAIADGIIQRAKREAISNLQHIRQTRGLSQIQLSDLSDVPLRVIQMCEDKQQDIESVEVRSVVNLSKVLGCTVEDLLD